jgi:pectate lyase
VGGYIQLTTAVSAKGNLTIAGQTAPGGGIGFRGGEISFANSSNVICRYIRVRPGSETADDTDDALSLYRAQNVIIDHSSFEFAPWNNIGAVSDDWQAHPVTNITFQDSIIADPTGQQFGAHMESVASQQAWYRNIFANSHNRNPLAKADTVFVNNLLYNYAAGYTTHTSTNFKHDIVNNYFVFGPASTGTDNTWFQVDKNQSIHYAGNLKDKDLNGALNGTETTPYWYQGEGTLLASPFSPETSATKPLDTASAARVAISLAGALPRDPIDALIISQVLTFGKGTTGLGANTAGPDGGLYTSQAQTGLPNDGYGAIAAGSKPTDTDDDGMSDAWESATGSDPKTDDAMKKAGSGYTLIERYLNWLAGPHATSSAGAAVDLDLSAYASGFSAVSPTYAVTAAQNGTVSLAADKHSAHFQANAGFHGLGAFAFTVTGSDGTAFTMTALVLAAP